MNFDETLSNVINELANGQRPSANELEELRLQARELARAQQILNNMLIPGTSIVEAPAVRVPGGDVIIDELGIFIKNNQEAALSFGDPTNTRNVLYILSDLSGFLSLVSTYLSGGVKLQIKTTGEETPYLKVREDPNQVDRILLECPGASQGARLAFGTVNAAKAIWLNEAGSAGGSTYIGIADKGTTPPNPPNNSLTSEGHIYITDGKLVFQYNDAGTVRYKYLDLTGTGVTWTHTTTAP